MMTFQQKYRDNQRSMERYAAFLEECPTLDEKINLSAEIGRLKTQNDQIGKMPFEATKNRAHDYEIQVNAFFDILPEKRPMKRTHKKTVNA